jgi:hypothetical protein
MGTKKYWRGQVDYEIRKSMEEMRRECPYATIHGLAVLGQRVAFYTKTGDEGIIPVRPPFDAAADVAPEDVGTCSE